MKTQLIKKLALSAAVAGVIGAGFTAAPADARTRVNLKIVVPAVSVGIGDPVCAPAPVEVIDPVIIRDDHRRFERIPVVRRDDHRFDRFDRGRGHDRR